LPIHPQRQRKEARKRLNELTKRNAKILLNRMSLAIASNDLQYTYAPGQVTGNNFAAAVQLINHEINKRLGIKAGQRGKLRRDDYLKGIELMDDVITSLTRRLKKKGVEDVEN